MQTQAVDLRGILRKFQQCLLGQQGSTVTLRPMAMLNPLQMTVLCGLRPRLKADCLAGKVCVLIPAG
jgi:hypothetical protein